MLIGRSECQSACQAARAKRSDSDTAVAATDNNNNNNKQEALKFCKLSAIAAPPPLLFFPCVVGWPQRRVCLRFASVTNGTQQRRQTTKQAKKMPHTTLTRTRTHTHTHLRTYASIECQNLEYHTDRHSQIHVSMHVRHAMLSFDFWLATLSL